MPSTQLKYLRELREMIKDTPLIVVVTGGSPVDLREVYQLSDALLFVWYPGERGGDAVADVLFGDVSPSGKLPVTFPMDETLLPDYKDYSMKGRTYKYSSAVPMFPFGFGLSYGSISLSEMNTTVLSVKKSKKKRFVTSIDQVTDTLVVSFVARNTGRILTEEVVQLYQQTEKATFRTPQFDLKEFLRIRLAPGEERSYSFHLSAKRLSDYDEEGSQTLVNGIHRLFLSTSLPTARSCELGIAPWLQAEVEVTVNK